MNKEWSDDELTLKSFSVSNMKAQKRREKDGTRLYLNNISEEKVPKKFSSQEKSCLCTSRGMINSTWFQSPLLFLQGV